LRFTFETALFNSAFKFNARSQWHYEKTRRLTAILRLYTAKAEGFSAAVVAQKWNEIDEDMDKIWPGWGDLPTRPTRTAAENSGNIVGVKDPA
jgi:hypothetical protein